MIKEYYFENWDDHNVDIDYEIMGEEYAILMNCCFKYSEFLSFDFKKDDFNCAQDILSYECYPDMSQNIEKNCNIEKQSKLLYLDSKGNITGLEPLLNRKYFEINDDVKRFVLGLRCVFDYLWQNNQKAPENLMFYRKNCSVLFSAMTHEGICSLYLRQDENFEDVLKNPQWRLKKKDR